MSTNGARRRHLDCAALTACASGSKPPESGYCTRCGRKVAGAYWPWAITSKNAKKPERPDTPLWCIRWLRLKGSGAMQYLQRSLSCTLGNRPEGSPPSYPAAAWRLFPACKRDTAAIHPSWIFYHISFRFAIVWHLFSFRFSENKHYLKSEISARLSSFVPSGRIASRKENSPYPLFRDILSKIQ